jgi:hypothetical protein
MKAQSTLLDRTASMTFKEPRVPFRIGSPCSGKGETPRLNG